MSEKQTFILNETSRHYLQECIKNAPDGFMVVISPPTRTLEQNAAQWPYLQGFSDQMKWTVNGEKVKLTSMEWKEVLTPAFEGEINQRLAMGYEMPGIVMLGRRTSEFGKKKFSEWYEWLIAAAALKGIEPVYKSGYKQK